MEKERLSTEQIVLEYKEDVHQLLKYIPWLESKSGQRVSSTYSEDGIEKSSIGIPVYDAALLSFVKAVKGTSLIDRNYAYAYARYGMRDCREELAAISKARITEMHLLKGILSKYILRGMTKSTVWALGVESGIFLNVLLKFRELIEFYEGPMA